MHRTEKQKKLRSLPRRIIAIFVMIAVLIGLLTLTVFAQNSYIITDGDNLTVHKSYSTDPEVVLDEVGIELSEEDTYTTTYNDGIGRIDIQRMQMVTVINRGERSVIGTYGETVAALLLRAGITLGANDILSCAENSLTHDGMTVEIVHKEIEILEYDETVPFETNYFEDPELDPEEEMTLVEGVDGVVHYRTQVVYENGKEVSREILSESVTTEAVTQLVICGSGRSIAPQPDLPEHVVSASVEGGEEPPQTETITDNTITTSTGVTYTYTKIVNSLATAYSCEYYSKGYGYTATGTLARVGAIAVDPTVIPLGTKMYVVSDDGQYVYGYCVAEDTGAGIKGTRIDLYFDTIAECIEFGARECTVYILG